MTTYNGAQRRTSNGQSGNFGFFGLTAIMGALALVLSVLGFVGPASATEGDTQSHVKQSSLSDHYADCGGDNASGQLNVTDPEGVTLESVTLSDGTVLGPDDVTTRLVGNVLQIDVPLSDGVYIVDAVINHPADWSGQFVLSHYDCNTPPPPPYECPTGTVWTDTDGDGKVDDGECNTPPPPPYECPAGKVWTDADGDGVVDEGECNTPPPPPVTDACPGMPGTQLPGTTCTTPPPPLVDVCPNMPGDQPVATVCVIPTPTPEPVVVKPSASVKASCVTEKFGEGVARLNNKNSNKKVSFRIVRSGPDKFVTVKAGKAKKVVLTGLRVGSVVKVKALGKVLAKTRVPAGCEPTPVPDTGFRMAASAT